jgi:2-haloacid dehalogenase
MTHPEFADIGACVFDAYGTLFDVHSPAQRAGGTLGDGAKKLSALWRQKQLEYTWLRSVMGEHADFWRVTGEALDYAMAAQEIADPALRDRLMELYLTLDPYPDVTEALQRLRAAGRSTAILSNGTPEMLRAAVESAAVAPLFDAILSVEEVGIYKPHPSVYQLAVDRLSVAAQRICFVSTNAWDAAGAAFFGFKVAWLNRFDQKPERLPGRPAAEITSLAALPKLLGI